MIVLYLSACPAGVRGDVTKWLMEIATGVYVGQLSLRTREALWERVCKHAGSGSAVMICSARNEQGFIYYVHNSSWEPVDYDGITLIRRPLPENKRENNSSQRLVLQQNDMDLLEITREKQASSVQGDHPSIISDEDSRTISQDSSKEAEEENDKKHMEVSCSDNPDKERDNKEIIVSSNMQSHLHRNQNNSYSGMYKSIALRYLFHIRCGLREWRFPIRLLLWIWRRQV